MLTNEQIPILEFETLDSTNTYGLKNFEGLADKTAVTALEQTNGKGRFDRKWVSGNFENIYLSLVLKPEKKDCLKNLTQYLCTVTANVIESYGIEAEIKYPNDVLVDGKKIAGILCESFLKKNVIQGVVLGIGVNLNMPLDVLDSIGQPAASLNLAAGKNIHRYEFLNKLIYEFFLNYDKVVDKGFSAFRDEYLKRVKFLGKTVGIRQRDGAQKEEYQALRIDSSGCLVVKTTDGAEKTIFSGDLIL